MNYVTKPALEFPKGLEISGNVTEPFLYVSFDVTLVRDS